MALVCQNVYIRTFAHCAFACGSMVFVFIVGHFAPRGKNDPPGVDLIDKRKPYIYPAAPPAATHDKRVDVIDKRKPYIYYSLLLSVHKHAHQALGIRRHQIGVPRGRVPSGCPGPGCRGPGGPLAAARVGRLHVARKVSWPPPAQSACSSH